MVGSFLMPSMPPSLITAFSPIIVTYSHALVIIEHVVQFTCRLKFTLTCSIAGNEAHYSILKQTQFVHLDDLCNAHFFRMSIQRQREGIYALAATLPFMTLQNCLEKNSPSTMSLKSEPSQLLDILHLFYSFFIFTNKVVFI